MRKDYVVAGLLAAAALPVGLPFMTAPILFPDLSRTVLWLLFFAGPTVTLLLFALAGFIARDRDPAAKWRRKASGFRRKVIRAGLGAVGIVSFFTWYFWPTDLLRADVPGYSTYVLIDIKDIPDFKRRYIYKFGPDSGPRVELFMSASNAYTYAVTDVHGETYPLEMTVGSAGVPIHEIVGIFSEVGLTNNSTILRVAVNGKEVARRTLPFMITLVGPAQPAYLGSSNENGDQHGNFWLKRITIWPLALSTEHIFDFDAQAKKENKP